MARSTGKSVAGKKARDPILLEIVAWIADRGRITEGWITDPDDPNGVSLYGLAEQQHIHVNPVHDTLDTVIHEVLHVVRPAFTELGVRRKTKALIRQLSNQEIETLWGIYQDRMRRERKRGKRQPSEQLG